MTYAEAIDFLFTSLPMFQRVGGAAYKASLDNTHRLDAYFQHPHRKFHTIHVAGTNGKGSTSHMLAAVLQQAGYRTGLYTSPHLSDFRERIKIDGEMIPESEVVSFVEDHQGVIREIRPSFFEMSVGMAFDYFERRQVEVAVIEVGMGGRLDSTNIITPLVSVITNISHDHGQFLGDTLEKIGVEKAGIIKPGIPVVIGETQAETEPIFAAVAKQNNAPLYWADQLYRTLSIKSKKGKQSILLKERSSDTPKEYILDLQGIYQEKNLKTVLTTLEVLRRQQAFVLTEEAIKAGLSQAARITGLSGRWQTLSEAPLIIADTGHNDAGIREMVEQLHRTPHEKLFMVFGVVNDKDLERLWPLLPREGYYIFTQAAIERALDATVLYRKALKEGFSGELASDIPTAVGRARALAKENDLIFIGGSTFTVAEALPLFSSD